MKAMSHNFFLPVLCNVTFRRVSWAFKVLFGLNSCQKLKSEFLLCGFDSRHAYCSMNFDPLPRSILWVLVSCATYEQ